MVKYDIQINKFQNDSDEILSKLNIVKYNENSLKYNSEQFGKYDNHQKQSESINDLEF